MRGFRVDSVLGKCTFCGHRVKEDDDSTASKFAKISFGRWICGGCLFGMKDAVDAVVEQYGKQFEKEAESKGLKFNPETGRYES
jgi:hypothetical protein